jgi:negative regulator of flagellin synthesis FlgM
MKIGQPSEIPASTPPVNAPAAQKTAAPPSAPAAASTDAAQSSRSAGVAVSVSQQVRALEKAGNDATADIDTQKVAAVRSAIQDGSYVVNPEAIADKLLANAQEMLKRTTQ